MRPDDAEPDATVVADLRDVSLDKLANLDGDSVFEATLRRLRDDAEAPAEGAVSGFSSAI